MEPSENKIENCRHGGGGNAYDSKFFRRHMADLDLVGVLKGMSYPGYKGCRRHRHTHSDVGYGFSVVFEKQRYRSVHKGEDYGKDLPRYHSLCDENKGGDSDEGGDTREYSLDSRKKRRYKDYGDRNEPKYRFKF